MSTRDKSTIQEKMLEKELAHLGAQRTPNSGAGFKKKGDLQDELTIYEAKTMMKKQQQYTIKQEELDTLEADRRRELKQFGVLAFDFGESKVDETYMIMKFTDFLELYETYLKTHEII